MLGNEHSFSVPLLSFSMVDPLVLCRDPLTVKAGQLLWARNGWWKACWAL